MNRCKTGLIALCPTVNSQCGHHFYSLTSGLHLNQRRWKNLLMTTGLLACKHSIVYRNSEIGEDVVSFGNRNGKIEVSHSRVNHDIPDHEETYDDVPMAGVYPNGELDDEIEDPSKEAETSDKGQVRTPLPKKKWPVVTKSP
jgi:hypothetical protein